MNPVTREEYEALNAKLDMYIRCQNQREKDFNELERKVYRLEQGQSNMSPIPMNIFEPQQGIAWLR